jgi:prepilin-type N-terminal cleavage/methylation domain-containing protein
VTARRAQRRGERGFTLIELLITLSVTTIGLIGLLALHLSIARGNDGASRSADAQQIAASEIESLRALPISTGTINLMTTLTGSSTLLLPTPPRILVVTGRTGMSFSVKTWVTSLAGASSSLLKIRTEVSWTEDGGTAGANNGQLDHMLPLEIIRTVEESL